MVSQANNDFAQHMYDQNAARLDPYAQMGIPAGGEIMGLLLGKAPTASTGGTWGSPTPSTPVAPAAPAYSGPSMQQILGMQHDGVPGNYAAAMANWNAAHASPTNALAPFASARPTATPSGNGAAAIRDGGSIPGVSTLHGAPIAVPSQPSGTPAHPTTTPTTPAHPATGTPATGSTPNAAQSAWDTFRNSTNYNFRLNEGLNSTASKYAAAGAFESGAEKKAINNYAQNFASNELANYMDQLYRQEALGASAASSLAGVGTNLVSQVSANNNNAASAAGNAQLVAGQGSANNWNAIGSGIGQVAGAVGGAFGSSYHPNNAANFDWNGAYNAQNQYDWPVAV